MNATPLWPALKFRRVGRLDWEAVDYRPRLLVSLGKELQASPRREADWAIGQLLRDLAGSPAALKALSRFPQQAPQDKRALNMAVHYLTLMRLKKEAPMAHVTVGKAWGVSASSVKDAHARFGADAKIELEALVEACMARKRHDKTSAVLRDVDADMRVRATLDSFRRRAAKPR